MSGLAAGRGPRRWRVFLAWGIAGRAPAGTVGGGSPGRSSFVNRSISEAGMRSLPPVSTPRSCPVRMSFMRVVFRSTPRRRAVSRRLRSCASRGARGGAGRSSHSCVSVLAMLWRTAVISWSCSRTPSMAEIRGLRLDDTTPRSCPGTWERPTAMCRSARIAVLHRKDRRGAVQGHPQTAGVWLPRLISTAMFEVGFRGLLD